MNEYRQLPGPPPHYQQQMPHRPPGPPPDMSLNLAPSIQPMKPEPLPISRTENGRNYELVVVQQPRRARMCGFGDKDRRPITPPPCVKLVITDAKTGKEIDCNDIEHTMFVLNVDLWSIDGKGEVNLVRHTTVTPSISGSQALSYAETRPIYAPIQPQSQQQFKNEPGQGSQNPQQPLNPYPRDGPPQVRAYAQHSDQDFSVRYNHGYGPHDIIHPSQNGLQYLPPQDLQQYQQMKAAGAVTAAQIHQSGRQENYPQQPGFLGSHSAPSNADEQQQQNQRPPQVPQGMFTRNLIGSLAASAFRLTDTDERIGIWFVLQDLSVRTEGHFRLRFSFVNVGIPQVPQQLLTPTGNPTSPGGLHTTNINTGKAPILAQCFSEVFTVYSAKKFPGVVESTPLSKCFATQGIKIPIRKDGPGSDKPKKGGDFDDDD